MMYNDDIEPRNIERLGIAITHLNEICANTRHRNRFTIRIGELTDSLDKLYEELKERTKVY